MLNVDSISRGLVIDHIKAGKSMEIYNFLNLDEIDCTVAMIKNVKSNKYGKKDIIKIEDKVDIDYNVLGYIDPDATVNVINNEVITEKVKLTLPQKLVNVIKCKNPRCVTSLEQEIVHEFKLTNRDKGIYRCVYCQQEDK